MEMVVVPISNSRDGWAEAFKSMAAAGDDKLLIDATLDIDENWTW